jgi:hypothetical protein
VTELGQTTDELLVVLGDVDHGMVSPIVKPGPTVPLTIFAVAAEPVPAAASAAATIAPSSRECVRVILLTSFASLG